MDYVKEREREREEQVDDSAEEQVDDSAEDSEEWKEDRVLDHDEVVHHQFLMRNKDRRSRQQLKKKDPKECKENPEKLQLHHQFLQRKEDHKTGALLRKKDRRTGTLLRKKDRRSRDQFSV